MLMAFLPLGEAYASERGLRRNPEAQLSSKSFGRVLQTDDEIDYYKLDDDFEYDGDDGDDDFEKWLEEDEENQTDENFQYIKTSKASDTVYIVTSKVQAWESNAESKVRAWESTANSTIWEFYEIPPSQWTTRQWELVFDIVLGLFAVCSLSLLCCVHCCCIQDFDPRSHDTDADLGTDYENLQRTQSLLEYESVMRGSGPGLESWEEEPQSQQHNNDERSRTLRLEMDHVSNAGDWDGDAKKNKTTSVTKKMRKKGGDPLLEARGKHNFVGYYL